MEYYSFFLTLHSVLFSLTSHYWAEPSLCSSHDFQSLFKRVKIIFYLFKKIQTLPSVIYPRWEPDLIYTVHIEVHFDMALFPPFSFAYHRQTENLALMKSLQVLLLTAKGSRFPSYDFCSRKVIISYCLNLLLQYAQLNRPGLAGWFTASG